MASTFSWAVPTNLRNNAEPVEPSDAATKNYVDNSSGGGGGPVVPAIYFTAVADGNNQTFSNTFIAAYTSNLDITLFYNGALLDSDFYTLSGDTITITTPIATGDSIDIIRTAIANANAISGYSNVQANAFLAAGLVGNILPDGDAVYSLGGPINQWKDLWVSNATIYFNTVPLSANNNTLSFAGEPLLISNGSSNITTTGIIETGGIVSDGNVVANTGYFFIGDGGLLSNISAGSNYSNANVESYLPTYTGDLPSVANIGATGALNVIGEITSFANVVASPGGFFIGDGGLLSNISGSGSYSNANVETYLPTYTGNLDSVDAITISGNITVNSGGFFIGDGGLLANVGGTGNAAGANTQIQFNDSNAFNGSANFTFTNTASGIVTIGGEMVLTGNGTIATIGSNLLLQPAGNAIVEVAGRQWIYDLSGNLTVPANSVIAPASGNLTLGSATMTGGNVIIGANTLLANGNITAVGNITAQAGAFFLGDGGLLSNVASAYGNAEVSTYLASGTDTAGIDTAGDIDAGGNITAANIGNAATVLRGDGGLISNISVAAGTQIVSGTTSVAIDGVDGNIDFTVAGNSFGTISQTQVAIGDLAGTTGSANTVALGTFAGYFALANTITIGSGAGQGHPVSSSLGANSIAIGVNASRGGLGVALPGNTIVLNATGANLNPAQADSFFVSPIRNDTGNTTNVVYYNTTTKEITYGLGVDSYSNANVEAYLNSGQMTDIIPSGNSVYSLGNLTNQWKDVWVSNATIYFNSIPLSANNNTLTFAGEPILVSGGDTNITTTGTIETGGMIADGNITANTGYFFLGDGTYLSNIAATVGETSFIIQTASFLATGSMRYGVDTTAGAITATLPATPATGQAVFFADAGGAYATNNLTVDRNGQTIMNDASDLTINTPNQNFGLFWSGSTWRVY
jgi:hypothetical protein